MRQSGSAVRASSHPFAQHISMLCEEIKHSAKIVPRFEDVECSNCDLSVKKKIFPRNPSLVFIKNNKNIL